MLSLTARKSPPPILPCFQYTRDLRIARQSYVLRRESAGSWIRSPRTACPTARALQASQQDSSIRPKADIPQYQRAVEQSRLAP